MYYTSKTSKLKQVKQCRSHINLCLWFWFSAPLMHDSQRCRPTKSQVLSVRVIPYRSKFSRSKNFGNMLKIT